MTPLPGALPAGERILWQGKPEWRALARDALHLRGLAAYMAVLVAAVGVSAALRGATPGQVALDTVRAACFAAVPVLLGLGFAWAAARQAAYTITDRRVVMRMGVALPMTLNLPFSRIASAGLRARPGGTGEIRLEVIGRDRMSWMVLWPHARVGRAAPVLRALHDAERAGQVLSRALAASVDQPVVLANVSRKVDSAAEDHGASTVAA